MTEELEKLLNEVREIKNILLPDMSDRLDSIRYDTWYKPHLSGGGDYFDVLKLPWQQDAYGILIADVSGHGAGAAVEAVMLDTILRTCNSNNITGPASVMNYANKHLFSNRLRGNFITAFIVNLDIEKKLIRCVNAGHPPVIAVTRSNDLIMLESASHIPLCIDMDHEYTETSIDAADIKKLVFYTDGVYELKTPDGEQLGMERFQEIVRNSVSIATIQTQVEQAVDPESLEDSDDITVLYLEIEP